MAVVVKQIISMVISIYLSLFWTAFAVLQMFWRFLWNPRTFFYVKPRPKPPTCLTEGWNHGYLSLPSIKLHYVFAGDRSKPLMLMLHGFPEFWYSWRHQIKEFSSSYRVVAIDLRGYGDSDKPTGVQNYAVAKLITDVQDVILALGYSTCTLVAHDWGGAIAWQVALQHPDMIDKLVICNCPHPTAFRKHLYGSLKQMLKSWYMFFFQMPYLPELMCRSCDMSFLDDVFTNPKRGGATNAKAFSPEDIEAWKYTFGKPGAFTPPINFYRAAFSRRTEPVRPVGVSSVVRPPTLIIWGTKDLALETSMAEDSAKCCENASVMYVEGASHWIQQDAPQQVNSYMREFLRGSH